MQSKKNAATNQAKNWLKMRENNGIRIIAEYMEIGDEFRKIRRNKS